MASAFSGSGGRNAAIWGAQQAVQNAQLIQNLLGEAKGAALDAIASAQPQTLSALDQGYAAGRGAYQGALDRYQPWTAAGARALDLYGDSLGLDGAGGNAGAVAAFQASPGYRYQVDQATDAVARKNSALGILGSGNTQQAIADRARQLANQDYGSWQSQLGGLANTGFQAAGAQAGLQKGIGDLDVGRGRDIANIYAADAGRRANTINTYAQLGANNLSGMGQSILGLGTKAFTAGDDASANRLNFGLNTAGTLINALKLIPGVGGTGGK
ncbi:hypothetical protein [Chelatococcus reniformis]|uniref:Tail fiber domain-containing protein n=1 Tax=Chelatococcus reniformis TaxID=1494448 RepID=A0A916XA27_9HYPH|nr:hypothetical protein [Chelatococcus reniformis]GGC58299.1 hypothetical protein GCM10010994_16550 [Chelatococcus reniformis]